jgi:hypothetical protein
MIDRRRFLQLTSGAALGLMTPRCSSSKSTGPADTIIAPSPMLWGDHGSDAAHAMIPTKSRPEGILEVFLMGGLNPWDTFYVVPEHGDPKKGGEFAGQQWWTWQDGEENIPDIFQLCGGGNRPLYEPFALDSEGLMVNLGPWLYPLRERKDILDRMRIHVVFHDLEPHEGACPLFLSGQPRGTPRMASTGSHVQRYWNAHGVANRTVPYSYVIYPTSNYFAGFNVESAFAIGSHPGTAQPLSIGLMPENPLSEQLSRATLTGYAAEVDAAIQFYLERFKAGYTAPGAPKSLDVPGLMHYIHARNAIQMSPDLQDLITPDLLKVMTGSECGYEAELDPSAMGLKIAAHLLTSPIDPARYVHTVDSGLIESKDGGYDTHEYHVRDTSRNAVHMCRELIQIINEPGENDPTKLDLDRHQVLITSEMGRTPYAQGGGNVRGLDHWPYGFIAVSIGGFVNDERAGVAGAIGEDARSITGITPAEYRAALLLSQGIWPFSPESFAVSDVRGANSELEAAMMVREKVLGFTS